MQHSCHDFLRVSNSSSQWQLHCLNGLVTLSNSESILHVPWSWTERGQLPKSFSTKTQFPTGTREPVQYNQACRMLEWAHALHMQPTKQMTLRLSLRSLLAFSALHILYGCSSTESIYNFSLWFVVFFLPNSFPQSEFSQHTCLRFILKLCCDRRWPYTFKTSTSTAVTLALVSCFLPLHLSCSYVLWRVLQKCSLKHHNYFQNTEATPDLCAEVLSLAPFKLRDGRIELCRIPGRSPWNSALRVSNEVKAKCLPRIPGVSDYSVFRSQCTWWGCSLLS